MLRLCVLFDDRDDAFAAGLCGSLLGNVTECDRCNNVIILGDTVGRQQSADRGIVADIAQLVDPTGTQTERGGCQQNILYCR